MKKIDKAIEILQDIKAGKILEYYNTTVYEWQECTNRFAIENLINYEYRIKPDPIYRPYNNAEEFLKDSKKHGPYLLNKDCIEDNILPCRVLHDGIIQTYHEKTHIYFHGIFHDYVWQDGSVCGVMEKQIEG